MMGIWLKRERERERESEREAPQNTIQLNIKLQNDNVSMQLKASERKKILRQEIDDDLLEILFFFKRVI